MFLRRDLLEEMIISILNNVEHEAPLGHIKENMQQAT
jgi:hypothetical protein